MVAVGAATVALVLAGIAGQQLAWGHTATDRSAASAPATVLLDGARLASNKQRVGTDPTLRADLAKLVSSADADLTSGPWSVLDKKQTPPSGDKHDYLSQAPYWWASKPPTASNPHGCPYVQKDGQRNPEADQISDHAERGSAFDAIPRLALAWYYTGDVRYAQRAELDVRAWFLDQATRMNPNLTYAQVIPCSTAVRGTGIIDFSEVFEPVVDAFALLDSGAPGWSAADQQGIRTWLGRLLDWLRTSQQGKQEAQAANNHGSWYDVQAAAITLYLGGTADAAAVVKGAEASRIAKQVKADGSQPLELARTRSWHYSNFNAQALCRLAEIGRHVGVNLWSYTASGGGSLPKAVDYTIAAAEHGKSSWPHQEIGTFDQTIALPQLHAAADEAGDAKAKAAIGHVPAPSGGDLWALLPAC
ncbi:alginate lyase family protein [Solihabitans fulvus]|uniref:Alginate lyase family protein n=2 Tax=Solihabitans fulvus TaxID=1892852 RepID=A0A5B2WW32_9PSEU|nr:alginate lyase family protein [Solihabitans fulvus]